MRKLRSSEVHLQLNHNPRDPGLLADYSVAGDEEAVLEVHLQLRLLLLLPLPPHPRLTEDRGHHGVSNTKMTTTFLKEITMFWRNFIKFSLKI